MSDDTNTVSALINVINKQSETISSLRTEIVELKLKLRNPTLCYIVENYKEAPSFEPIVDYSVITFPHLKINWTMHIGNVIISHYKKNNENDQSIWYSDSGGGSFYIRENDGWKVDKGGIRVTKLIVNPILNYVRNKCQENISELSNSIQTQFGYEKDKAYYQMQLLSEILKNIDSGILHKKIVKYIIPHFYSNEAHGMLTEDDCIKIQI